MARDVSSLFTPFWRRATVTAALFMLFVLNFTVLSRYRVANQCDPRNSTYQVYLSGNATIQQLKSLIDASVEASGPNKRFFFKTCSGNIIDIGKSCLRPPEERKDVGIPFVPLVDTRNNRDNQTNQTSTIAKLDEKHYSLVIVVPSHGKGRAGRDVLRQSWFNFAPNDTKMFFTVGTVAGTPQEKEIQQEIDEFGDLYILDVGDGYYNLSAKVLKSIAFASQHFKGDFLLKADDDSWVDVPTLLRVLKKRQKKRFYFGFLMDSAPVQREGRWAEPNWPWYFGDTFLPYMLGGGYVLSYDLAEYIYHAEPLVMVYTAEDITVGAALANLDIYREKSYSFKTYISHYGGCIEWPLVDHKIPGRAMIAMYQNFLKFGRMCKNITYEEEAAIEVQKKLERQGRAALEKAGQIEEEPSETNAPTETDEQEETSLDEMNPGQKREEPKDANEKEAKAWKKQWGK